MIEKLTEAALRQRFLVTIFTIVLVVYGLYTTVRLPVSAFPDVTNVQVQVNTEASGLSATDVEQLITFPVETSMLGLPGVTQVRSISKFGLSSVTVVFEDDVDVYFARQLIFERIASAKERIPEGFGTPQLGPITTGLGQIYLYTIEGGGLSAMELRTLNDWVVKYQLRGVPGVADVLSFGGDVRQYQVQINPDLLLRYDLTIDDVAKSIAENNRNAGGQYLIGTSEQLVVRGVGLIRGQRKGLIDIANIVIRSEDGTPIRVSDVAEIVYGSEVRQGAVSKNGQGEVVSGVVLQLKGANTRDVIGRVQARIDELEAGLPPGVKVVPYYDQGELTDKAIETVVDALLESAVLIVLMLFLFLGHFRAALVVVASIPLSLLVAFMMMGQFGLDANLMSLGGLAIGIGMMVDGSIVMVENIFRVLAEHDDSQEDRTQAIARAAREVARPVFFAVLIIVAVFLPLFTLQGVEGKLFGPLAFTTSFAMLGSLITALVIVPALTTVMLTGKLTEEDPRVVRLIKRIYHPMLRFALGHRTLTLLGALALLLCAVAATPFLGTEFVPELEEGTMAVRVTMLPTVSLPQALEIGKRIELRMLEYPEVTHALSRIGRAELGGDPEAVSNNEIFLGLRSPEDFEWVTAPNRIGLAQQMAEDLSKQFPGVLFNFSQPIATRVDELLSGVKAQIAIKIFGDELGTLSELGSQIEAVIRTVPGAADVQLEQIEGEGQLVIRADREAMARYGVNVSDVMNVVQQGVGGEAATQVLEGNRRFDVVVRVQEPMRSSVEAIGRLLVHAAGETRVPLSQVSHIQLEEAPPQVSHEQSQRRVVVQCNVRGRDMGGFVQAARKAVKRKIKLPPGYRITWGGQFENQQRAQATLMVVVPMSMLLILFLLFLSFNTLRHSLLVISNVPFAVIGGVFALTLSGQYLSVPSAVGFIAVFGVAVLNGVVLVSCINSHYDLGLNPAEAAAKGTMQRVRPILMTASVAMLGLIPLLISNGVGSEVQRPLATVVVGGLLTSTPMTLLVLPVLYTLFVRRHARSAHL